MSRVTTPPQARPATPGTPPMETTQVPREKIAMRAYEKWMKRGCAHGCDMQDWSEAERELREEMMRSGHSGTTGSMHTRR